MATLAGAFLFAMTGAVAVPEALPSLAIMGLEAKEGVTADTAAIISEHIVATIRKAARFSRIVSASDIQATLNFDQQRQLLNCSSSVCMAELAGALGVDYLLIGSLGRLGSTFVFNARILSTHDGQAISAVSRLVEGADESALLRSVGSVCQELLAAMPTGRDRNAPPPEAQASPRGEPGGATNDGPDALQIAGGGLGVVGALAVLGAILAGTSAVVASVALVAVYTNVPGLGLGAREEVFYGLLVSGVAASGLGVVAFVISAIVSAAGWAVFAVRR